MFPEEWMYTAVIIAIITLTGVITAILTVLSAMGELTYSYKTRHRLTSRGKTIVLLAILILLFSILQFFISDSKETFLAKKDAIEDSIRNEKIIKQVSQGIDSSSKTLFKNLSEALAKQNLRFDSLNISIVKLRDSAKTVVYNNELEKPILMITENGIKMTDSSGVRIFSLSITAPTTSVLVNYVDFFLVTTYKDGKTDISKVMRLLQKGTTLPGKTSLTKKPFSIVSKIDISEIKIVLFGSYSGTTNLKPIQLREVYLFEPKTNTTFELAPPQRDNFFDNYKHLLPKTKTVSSKTTPP